MPVPEAPLLREIYSTSNIRWMGAPTGQHYTIERAKRAKGPWKVIAKSVSNGRNRFNPETDSLFSDNSELVKGQEYFYRVRAVNESGTSAPSNIRSVKHR